MAAWLLIEMPRQVHTLALQEVNRHELDVGCWCHPKVERRDPRTLRCNRRPFIIHRDDKDRHDG